MAYADDEHLLALGRAVYAFQELEVLVLETFAQVAQVADLTAYAGLPFGPKLDRLAKALGADLSAGGILHDELARWVRSLRAIDTLRNDIFHAYPVQSGHVRVRRDGFVIPLHKRRLEAGQHRFAKATEEGWKLHEVCWPPGSANPV